MEGTGAGGNEQLRSAREEIQLYRSELETVQRLWNDLQTEHVKAQTALERARQDCEEEKAALNQRIRDLEDSIKALQMKVLANPNMLNPVVIELEAQRDAARKHRDELQEQLRALQRQ
ncbi:hypothetical protein F5Y10DRAFT_231263 [Nemania abortiva]|nr:hypothetical protein F5Y10DRAFT_231263 [Nemania abortiva]